MTAPTRLALLEAVAEAAELLEGGTYVIRGRTPEDADVYAHELDHIRDLMKCTADLRTHDAAQPAAVDSERPALSSVLAEVEAEVASAEAKWPPMNSAHEAYAVLLEEVDELWDHVKVNQKRRVMPAMRREAVQVAAMAIRFIRDVCDLHRGAK